MKHVERILTHLFLLLVVVLVLFPIAYALSASLKGNMELMLGGSNLIPKTFTYQNYVDAWRLARFQFYTWNSLVVSFFTVLGGIVISTMTAYVFNRGRFRGKRIVYTLYLGTMFISAGAITLFPVTRISYLMGILNLPGVAIVQIFTVGAFNLFLAYGYFKTISYEIDQAAQIDGCSFFRIYWNIIMPLAKPMIATIGLITFRFSWNNYLLPLVFTMGKQATYTLVVGVVSLKDLGGEGAAQWNLMMAGTMFSVIPIIVVYLILNKWFIQGLTSGAVKG